MITDEQRAGFAEDGFLIFDRPLIEPDDVEEVIGLLDPLFARFDELPDQVAHDLGGSRVPGRPALVPEIEYVTTLSPRLRRTLAVRTFHVLARDLFGGPVGVAFDHAIYKPPWSLGITPWHQDSAYDPSGRKTVTIWIALQATDSTNGCMRYVRGSQHGGRLIHEPIPDRHGRTITVAVDESQVVEAVLPAGGASVHREHAVHSSGPNNTDDPRRSLILEFAPAIGPIDSIRTRMTRAKVARIRHQLAR